MQKLGRLNKSQMVYGLICFLFGVVWLLAVRFAASNQVDPHYHANFAVYINGERELFDNFTFYEEVQSCFSDSANDPRTRVHMHNNVSHAVHVHDNASTWGHFFANLGFALGPDSIETDKGLFVDGADGKKLSFLFNNTSVSSVYNTAIQSEDSLLISYGSEDETGLQNQYQAIEQDAHDFNEQADPAACGGGKPLTLGERFKRAIKFWQ